MFLGDVKGPLDLTRFTAAVNPRCQNIVNISSYEPFESYNCS